MKIKPRGDIDQALALYAYENKVDDASDPDDQSYDVSGGSGFLEKSLSDFFDI